MKLVCISDTHHKHYYIDLPKGDILIHTGDFGYRGEQIERILIMEWIQWISKQYEHVVLIMGNHDINMTKRWYQSTHWCNELPNVHWLQDDSCTINGVKFYGSPYTPRFGNWGFGEPENELYKRFSHIPKNTDILITHGPPYSILDQNKHGECCGSKVLYEKIKQTPNVQYHLFGHIHEQGGKQLVIENTTFCNLSILDEHYQIKHKPFEIVI